MFWNIVKDVKSYPAVLAIICLIFFTACSDEFVSSGHTEDALMADSKMMVASAPEGLRNSGSPAEIERYVIHNAYAEITVADVETTFDGIVELVKSTGGYIESSSIGSDHGYQPFDGERADYLSANVTARVPSSELDELLKAVSNMAVAQPNISVNSLDVTAAYVDTEVTLENLRAVEKRFRSLLDDARNVSEILEVQDRLNEVRLEIDRYSAQLKHLEAQIEMSQLSVSIYGELPEEKDSLRDVISSAWTASIETINIIFRTLVSVIVFSWWIVLLISPALYLVYRRIRG